jgi:tyrosine-protein phosphatase YwqE
MTIYRTDSGKAIQVNPSTAMEATGMMDMLNMGAMTSGLQQNMMDTFMRRMNVFEPLLNNSELLDSQYDILTGHMPENMYEGVLILNSRNELSDYALYSLGLKDQGELRGQFTGLMQGEGVESVDMEFTYEDLMNLQFRVLAPTDLYEKTGTFWKDRSGDPDFLAGKLASYGFQRAVCTSHSTRLYRNTPSTVIPACERLQEALVQAGIRLELVPSLEYRFLPETWPEIRAKGWLLPWEGNHILVELPISNPRQLGGIDPAAEIRALLADGFQPVLAHPERYLWASEDDYRRWHDAGAAFQRNLASLEGFYGTAPAARAAQLLQGCCYSFLGTDTHSRKYTDAFDAILK